MKIDNIVIDGDRRAKVIGGKYISQSTTIIFLKYDDGSTGQIPRDWIRWQNGNYAVVEPADGTPCPLGAL